MANCPRPEAVAGQNNCRRCQKGYKTCYIHRFNWLTVRNQFARQIIEAFSTDERRKLTEVMQSAMLPISKTEVPLDQLSQSFIDKVAKVIRTEDK